MLETNRFGSFAASVSSRVNVTEVAGSASAFFEMKTRPVVVAAHSVDVSPGARSTATTLPPARSEPYGHVGVASAALEHVSRPAADESPSACQSPHCTLKSPVQRLQCVRNSASVIEPIAAVFVRHTCWVPSQSVLLTVGSEIIGM